VVFSSVAFLFYFLPATLLACYVAPRPLRNTILLLASLVFYTWGSGSFVLILLAMIAANFVLGLLADLGFRSGMARRRHLAIAGSVAVNLSILGYFKYSNFAVGQLNHVASWFSIPPFEWDPVILPIGISFFTFQAMSYTIDVARGTSPRLRNPVDFALYIALFSQLIAGPIVRYHEIAEQIRSRTETLDKFSRGASRFVHGLGKKLIVADSVAVIADATWALPADELTTATAWLGVAAYHIQLYFDFSGYSDMAIGIGMMLGFRFPENFRRPYSALSITDFWRRWHITLSSWFRDYVFVPLGGSRGSGFRTYVNLWTIFLLVGLWHGAAWIYVVFGTYHGVLMILERVTGQRPLDSASFPALRRALVTLFLLFGWVIFRSPSIGYAFDMLGTMLVLDGLPIVASVAEAVTNLNGFILLAGWTVVLIPAHLVMGRAMSSETPWLPGPARLALLVVVLVYSTSFAAARSFSPFIYFQF
jgi:alginate O-acetyltransferase complex protein AlgI